MLVKSWETISLEKKLSILLFLISGATFIFGCLCFILIEMYYSVHSFQNELSSIARVVGSNSRAALAFQDSDSANRVLSSLEVIESIEYAALYNTKDEVLAEYSTNGRGNEDLVPPFPDSPKWSFGSLELGWPILLEGEHVGTLFIRSGLSSFYDKIVSILLLLAGLLAISALIAYKLSFKLQSWITRPILSLTHASKRIYEENDYTVRLEGASKDEVGRLIAMFNQMLEQIQQRDSDIILAKEEAERAALTKSRFLANMSHEIRTPLNSILGFTEELMRTEIDEEQKSLLETVYYSGQILLSVVNSILDFSKIEAGKAVLRYSRIEIRSFLDQIMSIHEYNARKKSLILHPVQVASDIPELIFGDAPKISQILTNLIGNAVKFTPSGGFIDLSVSLREVRADSQQLLFKVRDSGIGIPTPNREDIFKSFTQVESALNKTYDGTGLGLTIASSLVTLMDGKIWVDSILHEGSTFFFYIEVPLSVPPEQIADQEVLDYQRIPAYPAETYVGTVDVASVGEGSQAILVVEDQKVNQKLLQRILLKEGFRVLLADNGKEALEQLEEQSVDLIISDIQMPVMDGYETARGIRAMEKEKPGSYTPIIALSASVLEEDRKRCFEAGMDEFLMKPFSRKKLLSLVHSYVRKQQSSSR